MKRILAVLLVMALLMSCVSLAVAEEKKSLTVWIPQYQFSKAEDAISDQDFWDGVFDKFEEENNCEVKVEIVGWGVYGDTFFTSLLNEDGPDVVYVTDNYDLVKRDLLLGLDPYLTDEQKDNYILWSTAPENAAGEKVIVPMDDGVAIGYVNTDILAEAGYDELPLEWDAFIEAGKIIQEKTGKRAFLQNWGATSGTSALMLAFWPYYFQAGGKMLDENGQISINNEAGLKTVEFLKKLFDEGIFDEDIVTESESVDKFANGEVAYIVADLNKGNTTFTPAGVNWQYVFSLKGDAGFGARTATDSFAVNKKTLERGNDELAVKALVYITSGEVMDAFHSQIFYLPPYTKDASFVKDEALYALTSAHSDAIYVVEEFEAKKSFEDTLLANIQDMFQGNLTPQEVLDETMEYYNTQLKEE
ncbi:MAG: extracellular solute-binding protein [Clostridia bacterium]|nr:extracellular solute-binding protein [Clostridia bacterium]